MRPIWDGASVGLSLACLAHCLALPLVAAALPALADLLRTPEWTHALLLILALPLSLGALAAGYRRHGRGLPFAVGAIGLALMAGGLGFEAYRLVEMGLTLAGSSLVALAHLRNWRLLVAAAPVEAAHP
jgi:hypothetical protein